MKKLYPCEMPGVFRLWKRLGLVKTALGDARRHRFRRWRELPARLAAGLRISYAKRSLNDILWTRKSDVLFILCSGPSALRFQEGFWKRVSVHDSLGINFSFMLPFQPTYHLFSWERDSVTREFMVNKFLEYHDKFRDTTILIPTKALFRLAHPRILPEYFPPQPKCHFFALPPVLSVEGAEAFNPANFSETLYYRNTASLALELGVRRFGYKKIVFVGADLDTPHHFYYGMPDMKPMVAKQQESGGDRFGKLACMIPKKGKALPFDQYLYAVAEYLKETNGVELYAATPECYLAKRLPAFFTTR